MSLLTQPLILLLLVPVIGILLIMVGLPAKKTALFISLFNFVLSIGIWFWFDPEMSGYQFSWNLPWAVFPLLPPIHLHLGIDGISMALVFLTTTVTLAAISVSSAQVKRAPEFFIYLLVMSLGALGAFVSLDLFFFFIFHEFALIPTFLLIGIWGNQNRQFASMQMTIYLTLGSLVLLAGLIALVLALPSNSRTFDLVQLQQFLQQNPLSSTTQNLIYPILLVGFGILISLFPFHSWAPTGYAAAPSGAAMLHAGVLKKFGIYGLLRIALPLLPGGLHTWQPWLIALLLGNVLYIGMVTLAQKELGTMIGFSSVMHMGYLFLGLVSFNLIGLSGVVLLMVAHGLSAALLFAVAGEVQQRTGENRFSHLGGLAQRMPFLSVAFIWGSFASIGLPGLANFPGELLIFFGAWLSHPYVTAAVLWGVVLSAVYQLRAVRAVFFGELPSRYEAVTDLHGFDQRFAYLLLMVALLFLGVFPQILLKTVQPALLTLSGG